MPEISIIMPLYNAEKFLEEALQSILKQTYKNFELICINDCSDDKTLEILKKYQKIDQRIIIDENEVRSGAAVARNKGIRQAKGKYLIFLDGDDIFDEELLELTYDTMEKNNADIGIYQIQHVDSELIHYKITREYSNRYIEKYCRNTFSVLENDSFVFTRWACSTWSQMIKRDLIISNKLEFQNLPCSNDVYFIKMTQILAERIIVVNSNKIMVYARDHFTPTRISFDRDPMNAYLAIKKLGEELVDRGLFSKAYEHFYFQVYHLLKYATLGIKNEKKIREWYNFLQKQGIEELKSLDRDSYNKVNDYLKEKLESFIKYEFSSGWYIRNDIFAYYLMKEKDKVLSVIRNIQNQGLKIALWGLGINGNIMLQFLIKNNIDLFCIIDKSTKKQGQKLGEYIIESPEKMLSKVDVILFTSNKIYEEMKDELKNNRAKLLNIYEIVDIV